VDGAEPRVAPRDVSPLCRASLWALFLRLTPCWCTVFRWRRWRVCFRLLYDHCVAVNCCVRFLHLRCSSRWLPPPACLVVIQRSTVVPSCLPFCISAMSVRDFATTTHAAWLCVPASLPLFCYLCRASTRLSVYAYSSCSLAVFLRIIQQRRRTRYENIHFCLLHSSITSCAGCSLRCSTL